MGALSRAKAAVKLHTLLDLRGNIPSVIHITDGKLHDVNILDQLIPEAGAFYVMDRGYIDFERLARFHDAGSFFVTRAKAPCDSGVATPIPSTGHWLDLRSDGRSHGRARRARISPRHCVGSGFAIHNRASG